MEKFLIVGGGGRESAFAQKCAEEVVVCAVLDHPNPSIVDCVRRTGGAYLIADSASPPTVLRFAQENAVDYAFVNSDAPLAAGVVDALLDGGIKTVGGTRAASRIEWDKIYSIRLVEKTSPANTPFYRTAGTESELDAAIKEFESRGMQAAIKPQGLTGGKGVKVMPQHLADYEECRAYAARLLRENPEQRVLLAEKLRGAEFTVMGFTDGKTLAAAPATYDYPYRFENDAGPGTGGMGCFAVADKKLPFMSDADFAECEGIMRRALDEMRANGLHFTGVLNGGFFKTAEGIRFMEFNGRFGDPEALNILMVLEGAFPELLKTLHAGTLRPADVRFAKQATVVKYLVSREYPLAGAGTVSFAVDHPALEAEGIKVFCASCSGGDGGVYATLGKPSRIIALGCAADKTEDASERINRAIDRHISGNLDFRRDIGARDNLRALMQPPTPK